MNSIIKGQVPAYFATIHMAGCIDEARPIIQKYVLKGGCIELTEVEYIYTGGREKGFTARLMAYARFPKTPHVIFKEAKELGDELLDALSQMSYSIETTDDSFYIEREGAVKAPAPASK